MRKRYFIFENIFYKIKIYVSHCKTLVTPKNKYIIQNQVFTYQEGHKNAKREELKTERMNRAEKPLNKNYMVVHRKNINSNDGRLKTKDQLYNDYKLDKKAIYNQARKQSKRPKSSSNSQGLTKKINSKKPILFSTVDKRPPNAFLTQKFAWKDINSVPSHVICSPSHSPKKISKKHAYESVNSGSGRQKVKYSKQPMSIKQKNELQNKVLRPYPYSYKNEIIKYPQKEAKKIYSKSERNKLKISKEKFLKSKENMLHLGDTNTLHSAREFQASLTDRSGNSNLKWTLKSRDGEKSKVKNRKIDDFEKLFYQSMSNEKGKIISQKGMDFSQIKSYKIHHHPSSYRSISKNSKNAKHVKSKKSFKLCESKPKKSKKVSPAGGKYKYRSNSRGTKNKFLTEDSSRCSGIVKNLGQKKGSINQSQSKSKIIPQTARYSSSGMDKYFKFKQNQVIGITEQQKHVKKVKSLKNLKST